MEEPIFEAIERHDLAGLASLLASGADPNQIEVDILRRRPLHVAIVALEDDPSLDAVKMLVAAGADLDEPSLGLGGGTPLLCALFNDHAHAALYLLDAGADPNRVGGEGDSPLRWAVEQGDHAMVELLLDRGAHRSIDGFGGWEGATALGIATRRLDAEAVSMLLAAGANPDGLDLDRQKARERLPVLTPDNAERWHLTEAALSNAEELSPDSPRM